MTGSVDRIAWSVDVAAIGACVVLVATGTATTLQGAPGTAILVIGLGVVVVGASLSAAAAGTAQRMAPVLLAVFVTGLLTADDARLTVIGFALSSLLPVAAIRAARSRARLLAGCVAALAVVLAVVRITLRDPFRELRCAPACVTNPYLITRSPGTVRVVEHVLAGAVLAWVVVETFSRRHRRRVAPVAALSASAVWSVQLLLQPRPAVEGVLSTSVLGLEVGLIGLGAGVPAIGLARTALTRWRIFRFARSLSGSSDLWSIERNLRRATRDPALRIQLGDHAHRSAAPGTATAIHRGGRTIATIVHSTSAGSRLQGAVDPAIAIAIEIELLTTLARHQLEELERTSALAVVTSDEARRRLERDLHDGAQQRLLVTGMHLAHEAAAAGEGGALLGTAAVEVAAALTDLRRIGRGDAAIIDELGIDDALTALTGDSDLPLLIRSHRCGDAAHECWPAAAATTAYRVVVGSVVDAVRAGAPQLRVTLSCHGDGHGRSVMTSHDCGRAADRSIERDRVLVTGGRVVDADVHSSAFDAWLP